MVDENNGIDYRKVFESVFVKKYSNKDDVEIIDIAGEVRVTIYGKVIFMETGIGVSQNRLWGNIIETILVSGVKYHMPK